MIADAVMEMAYINGDNGEVGEADQHETRSRQTVNGHAPIAV